MSCTSKAEIYSCIYLVDICVLIQNRVSPFNEPFWEKSSSWEIQMADPVWLQLVIWTVSSVLPRKYWDVERGTPLGLFSSLDLNISHTQKSFEVNFMKWKHMMPLYKQNKLD